MLRPLRKLGFAAFILFTPLWTIYSLAGAWRVATFQPDNFESPFPILLIRVGATILTIVVAFAPEILILKQHPKIRNWVLSRLFRVLNLGSHSSGSNDCKRDSWR